MSCLNYRVTWPVTVPAPTEMLLALCINIVVSVVGAGAVVRTIPAVSEMFINAGLFGRDLCKRDRTTKVPESMGMVSGSVFLIIMFLFLGVPFGQHFIHPSSPFPHAAFSEYLTSLLSICCMLFLGFADDVLTLKWRYKLVLPTLASLPLLMVYYINMGSTTVVVPKLLRQWIGLTLNIGPLYYLYMSMLAVFCTNAINIYAGINGLECGQAVVIGASVAVFNVVELGGYQSESHYFSLCIIIPFTASSLGLFYYNRYPSRAFVGDTFTYFAGMTFAVVAIIGHFSKTVLLFFLPQIFNFVYSVPQLFHFVPCPRHRLPKYNEKMDKLEPSVAEFKAKDIRQPLFVALRLLTRLGLVNLEEGLGEDGKMCRVNNLTLINLALLKLGPQHEASLTNKLLILQVVCTALAFFIRYPLADMFF
ncbi:UDP-N-acetylglucosamine--dolichyl-phosphate N-acetylglucosaminephosphotransferase isoform X2 [Procambarus clarkii]|uniref:UDP-N-acetylglucosamine--dolichyl-phosphate N-acetylglucosaminephosphotransferase isoform X2 n=1 Tax=Procambarus clarkii TaxID=6728 RepID=UPI001E677138|nr:UDP-N-acetylglucosamine--dolichyl-phosphate N-acetylglucosaminephosphotransferase-like isoform X2 [Procambarus clarkii]